LRLLALLSRAELTVTEITQVLGQSQPRVSRHLKLLSDAGLIDRFREGTWAFHRLADRGESADVARQLLELMPADAPELKADAARLESVRAARNEAAAAYFRENAKGWARIRSLYVSEAEVEAAVVQLVGGGAIDDFIDLGTGTGRMLEIMAPYVKRGVGFDLSHEMLGIARSNLEKAGINTVSVRHGDILRLPVQSGAGADLVIIHQVLHFIENPQAVVAEAARVLKPKGRILIVDFAPHDLEFLRDAHAHRRLGFGDSEVLHWAESAGLGITATKVLPPKSGEGELTVCLWLLGETQTQSAKKSAKVTA
jgi:ArsR family transcriptional regulator